ncbi:MAG: hypothetical protein CMK98_13565 [Pseudomonas sp.]|nr:hypothetical protein [Pseudomonas sp.]
MKRRTLADALAEAPTAGGLAVCDAADHLHARLTDQRDQIIELQLDAAEMLRLCTARGRL